MLRKNAMMIMLGALILSVTYIFAIDEYDAKPDTLQWLCEQIKRENIEYEEVGIRLQGIQYDDILTSDEIQEKMDTMDEMLSHESSCSKLCKLVHDTSAETFMEETERVKESESEVSELSYQYHFYIKNQKDIHYNTYYDLEITGVEDMAQLDQLRMRGINQLEAWQVNVKETTYFKGLIGGEVSETERLQIKEEFFDKLQAVSTNYYEDDLNATTCAYYGYTPRVKDYVLEKSGKKTNVQISFKYDETRGRTEIIIAFPFYNTPF